VAMFKSAGYTVLIKDDRTGEVYPMENVKIVRESKLIGKVS